MSTETNDTDTSAPVGWFEIATDDPEAARQFYAAAFGWTFDVQGPYSIITTGPDQLQGGIQDTSIPLPAGTPTAYAIPCVQVSDVAASCATVESLGGKVTVVPTEIPSGLVFAHIADPAGNHIGLFSPPPIPAA